MEWFYAVSSAARHHGDPGSIPGMKNDHELDFWKSYITFLKTLLSTDECEIISILYFYTRPTLGTFQLCEF